MRLVRFLRKYLEAPVILFPHPHPRLLPEGEEHKVKVSEYLHSHLNRIYAAIKLRNRYAVLGKQSLPYALTNRVWEREIRILCLTIPYPPYIALLCITVRPLNANLNNLL